MGTYVKNGNKCIGCSCSFPDDCPGCNNLKSQVALIRIASDRKNEVNKLKALLADCLFDLCQICIVVNPQHKNCKQCNDTDDYREAIK